MRTILQIHFYFYWLARNSLLLWQVANGLFSPIKETASGVPVTMTGGSPFGEGTASTDGSWTKNKSEIMLLNSHVPQPNRWAQRQHERWE